MPMLVCDLCHEEIGLDGFGQTTADTIICLDCLEATKRKQSDEYVTVAQPDDVRPDHVVVTVTEWNVSRCTHGVNPFSDN